MIEHIKRIVGEYLSQFVRPKFGIITSYDPSKYAVKVMLQPEQIETGWIQLSAPWVGNQYGCVYGPVQGDVVRVDFIDGNAQAAVVGGRFFSDTTPPPQVASGQWLVMDKSGNTVHFNNAGTISIKAPTQVTIDTPLVVCTHDLVAGGVSVMHHVHGGVQSGGSNTGEPV